MNRAVCDFHLHSTVSDGTLDPIELVEAVARAGIETMALTDHDHVGGCEAARSRGRDLGVEVLAGAEISVAEENGRQLHMLGLGLDLESEPLLAGLRAAREMRARRAAEIVDRLNDAGVPLSIERVRDSARGVGRDVAVGRPHIAAALVADGFCDDVDQAFSRWLRKGRPAYVGYRGLSALQAIELIHAGGGVASLAHPPLSIGVDAAGGLEAFIEPLIRDGIDGLEVQHPSHRPRTRRRLRKLVRRHGLIATGGSDFHGSQGRYGPDVRIGIGRGNVAVGREVREAILGRIRELTAPEAAGNLASS